MPVTNSLEQATTIWCAPEKGQKESAAKGANVNHRVHQLVEEKNYSTSKWASSTTSLLPQPVTPCSLHGVCCQCLSSQTLELKTAIGRATAKGGASAIAGTDVPQRDRAEQDPSSQASRSL